MVVSNNFVVKFDECRFITLLLTACTTRTPFLNIAPTVYYHLWFMIQTETHTNREKNSGFLKDTQQQQQEKAKHTDIIMMNEFG